MRSLNFAVTLLLANSNAIKLRYPESEGPTKTDYGDSDSTVLYREADRSVAGDKPSGWTNPLSWRDDGTDDDQVVNM